MQNRRHQRVKHLINELHTDAEKVTLLEVKRTAAKQAIRDAKATQAVTQLALDKATVNYQRKVKTFQLLDEILAEFKFSLKQREQSAELDAIKHNKRSNKTAEQTLASVMACLEALPEAQRAAIIKVMEAKQQGVLNDN